MPLANSNLQITSLDFFDMKQNFVTWLRGQDYFTNYDLAGEGMDILLDTLLYNTHYQAFYNNMIANERYMDSVQLRPNILSLAKAINYVPMSATGAYATVNITVTPSITEDQSTNSLTIDKYTKFLGADKNNIKQPFSAVNSNTAIKVGGSFNFSNIALRQGEVVTHQFIMSANNTARRFNIPSSNVDITTLSVQVQESSSNTFTQAFTLADDLTVITANSAIYYVEEDNNLEYTIYFGDGYIGQRPDNGNIIIINYLDTVGSNANGVQTFVNVDPFGGKFTQNIKITTSQGSFGGQDKEAIEDIRYRAMSSYTTQNRAVTFKDYESLILQDFPAIKAVSVWGGEENVPPTYGQVYMSLQPQDYYSLTLLDKQNITNSLIANRNVVTVIPQIVDPNYCYLLVSGDVSYDPNSTTKTAAELKSTVTSAILDYVNTELTGFKSTFRKSRLSFYIESSDPCITGTDLTIYLQQQIIVQFNKIQNYTIDFGAPIQKGTISTAHLYTYPQIVVSDSTGIQRSVYIEEVPSSSTGIDSIQLNNPGNSYTYPPTITIVGDGSGATATASIVNGRISAITVTNQGINYSHASVQISGGGGISGSATAKLQSRYGQLRSFYYNSNFQRVILNALAGTIDYDLGIVTLTNLIPLSLVSNAFYQNDVWTVSVPPDGDQVYPQRNRIITLDPKNSQSIQINMIAES